MRRLIVGILTAVTLFTLTGNASADGSDGVTRFGTDLYLKLGGRSGNVVFSPYNIYSCLSMAYAGAGGETRKQIAAALSLPIEPEKLAASIETLETPMEKLRSGNAGFTLTTANASWVKKGYEILPGYAALLKSLFRTSAFTFDSPSQAVTDVNTWVSERTNAKIQNLLSPGAVGGETRLILASALYMLAKWQRPFEKGNTVDLPFWSGKESSKQSKFISQKSRFDYGERDDLQYARLPYRGGASFWIILPKERDGLKAVEQKLTAPFLNAIFSGAELKQVIVTLPKIDSSTSLELGPALRALGLTDAFSDRADFSGISGTKDLAISDVVHQAKIAVDEDGTEAAAATAIIMRQLAAPMPDSEEPKILKADHPFLYFVRDDASGIILFMGRFSEA